MLNFNIVATNPKALLARGYFIGTLRAKSKGRACVVSFTTGTPCETFAELTEKGFQSIRKPDWWDTTKVSFKKTAFVYHGNLTNDTYPIVIRKGLKLYAPIYEDGVTPRTFLA